MLTKLVLAAGAQGRVRPPAPLMVYPALFAAPTRTIGTELG